MAVVKDRRAVRYDISLPFDRIRMEYARPPVSEADKDFARRELRPIMERMSLQELDALRFQHIYLTAAEMAQLKESVMAPKRMEAEEEAERIRLEQLRKRQSRTLLRAADASPILLRPARNTPSLLQRLLRSC